MKFKHSNINDDMDYRDHVVANDKEYVNDFLTSFSKPILEYVGKMIMNVCPVEEYSIENKTYYKNYAVPLLGMYYLYIAAKHPGDEKDGELPIEAPQWNALNAYSADNNSTLFHYVNIITIRHFIKIAAGDDGEGKGPEKPVSEDEIFNYLKKIYYDQDVVTDDLAADIINDITNALNDFRNADGDHENEKNNREKDYKLLLLSCMYDYRWEDIADDLKDYFEFKNEKRNVLLSSSEIDFSVFSREEKKIIQTRLSQWKKRAILHFTRHIYKSDKYVYLKGAIINHRISRKPQTK